MRGDPVTTKIDQTILASDPKRQGNCVAACAATHLGLPLHQVPHFIEIDPGATVDGTEGSDRWWWLLVGFMAARGLWPLELTTIDDADPGETVWVAGPSSRGVMHQVLYRDGRLWHDPHPSRDGVLDITEVLVWRPRTHDHTPTSEHPWEYGVRMTSGGIVAVGLSKAEAQERVDACPDARCCSVYRRAPGRSWEPAPALPTEETDRG